GAPGLLRWLVAARAYAEETARLTLPEPHASLVAGMVFGAASGLPSELRAALTTTGTSHLTAVSGANVALVAGGLLVVAVRVVGRRSASLVAIAGVWLYTLLVGAPPSALRAASMATLALAARGLGRQSDTIGGLALAAAILLGWNPGLAGDVGFQLSVAATAGLVLLTRPIEAWLRLVPHPIRGWLAVAIAAQLATLPIVLGTFQRLSLISLLANVLAAPLVPPIMLVGAALAVLGRLPILDSVLGWAGWGLTALLLFVIEQCAAVPGAVMAVGQLPSGLAVAWYGVLGCWVAASSADVRALGIPPRLLHGVALASVSLVPLVLLVGWGQAERPGSVVVSLLDTAPTAALIRAPDGRTVLVLTSQPGPGLVAGAGSSLDLWEGTIDTVISPDGIRADVDLLSLGDADLLLQAADRESLQPGAAADLGNGLSIAIVDLRLVDDRPVLDLLILAEGAAILLPGPGSPSQHWADIPADLPSITMLPASAVSWARMLPPRPWLLLVGEPGLARARGDSGVPFLTRREYGIVEIALRDGRMSVRTERCASGTRCQIELPPPIVTRLLPAADD
ncbi:MAG: ComEC/Rec2 family competence protein, partial [Chloroflexota bacterium]